MEVKSKSPVGMIFMAERCRFGACGIEGGGDGARGEVLVDDVPINHRENIVLREGQRVVLRTPGGGGAGPADARSAEAIARDKGAGYVS